MAYSSSADTSRVLCSYFVNGACRQGRSCKFAHDLSKKPSAVCRFYLQGACSYGSSCRYDHVRTKQSVNKPASVKKEVPPVGNHLLGPMRSTPTPADTHQFGKLVTLKKGVDVREVAFADNAVTPPEMVNELQESDMTEETCPGYPTYSEVARGANESVNVESLKSELCPYAQKGVCQYEACAYMHGMVCELCGLQALHPEDAAQREQHHEACLAAHEAAMERAFGAQRSADKQCGICLETVVYKMSPGERRFGILTGCTHVYCLACIRKWRAGEDTRLVKETVRSCPECRVLSDFVVPSEFWVEDPHDKENLIAAYKESLRVRRCRYYDGGHGQCPFGNSCFYLHVNPDGREAARCPTSYPRLRYNEAVEVERQSGLLLWDFLDAATASRANRESEYAEGTGHDFTVDGPAEGVADRGTEAETVDGADIGIHSDTGSDGMRGPIVPEDGNTRDTSDFATTGLSQGGSAQHETDQFAPPELVVQQEREAWQQYSGWSRLT